METINWEQEFKHISKINQVENEDVYDNFNLEELESKKNLYTSKLIELQEEKEKIDKIMEDLTPKISMLNVELSMIDRKLLVISKE